MIMFRGMGITHLIAGFSMLALYVAGFDMGHGDTELIIKSQLIGGAVMSAIGFKFKL